LTSVCTVRILVQGVNMNRSANVVDSTEV
jgi:hypothetical protein